MPGHPVFTTQVDPPVLTTQVDPPVLTTQVDSPVLMQKLRELDTFAGNSSPRLSQAVVDKAKEHVEKAFYQAKMLNNITSIE